MKYFLVVLAFILSGQCFAQLANPKIVVVRKKSDAITKASALPTDGGNVVILIAFDESEVLAAALDGETLAEKKRIYRIQALEKARLYIRDALEGLNQTNASIDDEVNAKKALLDAEAAAKKAARPNDAELDPESP